MSFVEVQGICKMLGSSVILEGVDFTLEEGRIYGLLGLNGAGKSTLLKILSGVLLKDAGVYSLEGEQFSHMDDFFREKIGFLPEKIPVFSGYSVWNYLFFWAKVVGLKRKDAEVQIADLAEKLGFADQIDTSVNVLSKGYLQRVGVASAVLGEPKLLLLDEPMSGLDPSQISCLRNFLVSLSKKKGTTILISSHLLDEISRFCDEILILSQQKIFLRGEPSKMGMEQIGAFQFDFETKDQSVLMKKIAEEKFSGAQVKFLEGTSISIFKQGSEFFSAEDAQSLLKYFWDRKGSGLLGFSSKKTSLQDIFLSAVS